jgi:hypothetical protein
MATAKNVLASRHDWDIAACDLAAIYRELNGSLARH